MPRLCPDCRNGFLHRIPGKSFQCSICKKIKSADLIAPPKRLKKGLYEIKVPEYKPQRRSK